MNSKGHFIISLSKSAIRIIGGCVALVVGNILPLALGIIIAEIKKSRFSGCANQISMTAMYPPLLNI